MTEEELHRELGRMHVERKDAKGQLACVENKIRRLKAALSVAQDALEEKLAVVASGRRALLQEQECQALLPRPG